MSSSENNNEETVIVEGSTTMRFPAKEKGNVFYNPVQVQNRDLSILMICLYAERRLVRQAVKARKKQLNKELSQEEKKRMLQEYEQTLNGTQLVQDDKQENGITILDALAASGLRSIRYWKEIPGVRHVTINDLDPLAIQRARDNLEGNGLGDVVLSSSQPNGTDVHHRQDGIQLQQGDATHEMYLSRRPPNLVQVPAHQLCQKDQFDVIDLDPYGSAAPFLDAAIQGVVDGGLLCVTCTDMVALGGSHPETAYGRYGGSMPIPNAKYLQEVALRILLYSISTTAAKYGRTIRPVLSVGMAFYIRVFVEVRVDKAGVNELSTKVGQVYQSTQCPSFHVLPHGIFGKHGRSVYQPNRIVPSLCQETGAPLKVGGPLWLGPLHDEAVVQEALERLEEQEQQPASSIVPNMELIATRKRLHGVLTSVSEELNDVPLYYTLPDLCKTLAMTSPPLDNIKGALVNAGYRVSGYHKEPQAIKTNAPSSVVWDIMRSWYKKTQQDDTSGESKKKQTKNEQVNLAKNKILAVEPSIDVDFTIPKGSTKKKATRFPENPEKNWGPKPASGMFSKKRKKLDELTKDSPK